MTFRSLTVASVALASAATLAACSGEREAESKTPVAEAEVTTTQPPEAISDQTLQATADSAAVAASQPEPGAMTTGTMTTDTMSTGTMSGGAVTSSTTTTTTNP